LKNYITLNIYIMRCRKKEIKTKNRQNVLKAQINEKSDKMFEEDFFEVEELQADNGKVKLSAETFDVCKYIRALK